MSIAVTVNNEDAFKAALADLRSDSSETKYIVAHHPNVNPNCLELLASGTGDVDEMLTHFDPSQVVYGMVRVEEKFEISTTTKFIFIKQVGEKVGFVKKGRFGIVTSAIKEILGQYHLEIAIDAPDGTSQRDVTTKVAELSNQKSAVIESTEGRVMRGFTSSSPNVERKKNTALNYTGGLASTEDVPKTMHRLEATESLRDALKSVRDDKSSTTWVVGEYENGDIKANNLTLVASGDGGLQGITQHFAEDKVAYSLLRVTDVVDGHTTVKFVFISFIGDKVGMVQKAKLATHKGAVQAVFHQFHVDFYISAANDISEVAIKNKVSSASGSANHVIQCAA